MTTTEPVEKKAFDRWTLREESEIDYGHLGKTSKESLTSFGGDDEVGGGFYITTAINYTNGPGHMGHAYEAATSDVIARFHRLWGIQPSYFVTGADEHGQKIATTAADQGMEPIDICNKVRKSKGRQAKKGKERERESTQKKIDFLVVCLGQEPDLGLAFFSFDRHEERQSNDF